MVALLCEEEQICAMGPGMLIGKCALTTLVGRSPKAAQETREAPVFSNTEPIPLAKSAPIREL